MFVFKESLAELKMWDVNSFIITFITEKNTIHTWSFNLCYCCRPHILYVLFDILQIIWMICLDKLYWYIYTGARERFLLRGGPTNKKIRFWQFLKILLYKFSIQGGARPPQAPPGPTPLSMYPFENLVLYLLSTATSKADLRLNLMEQFISMWIFFQLSHTSIEIA